MDKKEILNRAKKENKILDEWKVDINKNAAIVSSVVAITTIGIMLIISMVQQIKTGSSFAEPAIFIFIISMMYWSNYLTSYYYNRKPLELVITIISSACSLLSLASLVV